LSEASHRETPRERVLTALDGGEPDRVPRALSFYRVETAGRSAAEVARDLREAVETFVGEARWHDDVSLVVVRRAGRESVREPGAEAGGLTGPVLGN
jgi:hypothetical protein